MRRKFPSDYSVITFATKKLDYVRLALNCSQSVLIHNDIKVFIVSDLNFLIPSKFQNNIFIIPPKTKHVSLGIAIKLYADQYVQTRHTLFIDSDCICFGDLHKIFIAGKDQDVTVAGNVVQAKNWCGAEQAQIIKQYFNLSSLIRFNGGMYYIKNSSFSMAIFEKAREIAEHYDSYGFHRINNKGINEEGPLSIAMMLYNQRPMTDDGSLMTDMHTDQRPRTINVLTGERVMRNPKHPLPNHRPWHPEKYSPILLHFGGNNLKVYPYRSQSLLLKLSAQKVPAALAITLINIFIHFPYRNFYWLTGLLRKLKISL